MVALAIGGAFAPLIAGQVAAASSTSSPYPAGTMFVADQNCACVWKILPSGSPSVFVGISESPQDVATDGAGDLFWTEAQSGHVNELTAGGVTQTLATLTSPWGIAVDGSGNVFVGAFGAPGGGPAGLYEIPPGGSPTLVTSSFGAFTSLAVDGNGDIWGAGASASLVLVPHGSAVGEPVSLPGVAYVNGVRIDSANDLYISTGSGTTAGMKISPGVLTPTTFGSGLPFTEGVAVDGTGNVFVGTPSGVPGFGKVYEIASGGSQSLYANGSMADTGGLALWPPLTPTVRTNSSTALSTLSPSTVTTLKPVSVTVKVSPARTVGVVEFVDNGSPIGSPTTTSGGVAHLKTTLPAGTNVITAVYLGDASYGPSVSNPLTFTATAIKSKTVLTAPSGTTVPGTGSASATATVTGFGGTPSGTVEFLVKGSVVATGTLSAGQVTASFPLSPGHSTVTAVYSGDNVFATSTSRGIVFTTTPPYNASLSTRIAYGKPDSQKAKEATIRVTVGGLRPLGPPTGTVTATSGFTCTALTPGTGLLSTASCTSLIPFGTSETVIITYGGDATYASVGQSVFVSNSGGGGG